MALRVTPIGAGQAVGRSCILLEIGGARVLLDCGVSAKAVGTPDHIPDFDLLKQHGDSLNEALDAVIITHYHLDHVGSLPYLTEVLGYTGPVLMTQPTKAVAKVILEDYVKVNDIRTGGSLFSHEQVDACLSRISCFQLRERHTVSDDVSVTPYYAGHVLGAVMVMVECGGYSAFYTGDFTSSPGTLLSAAHAPLMLRPDVLITESTNVTTIRSSKRAKEQELCRKIQDTLENGGKVLIPSLSVGKAQELCQLMEDHWSRMGLDFPIYVSRGMMGKCLAYFDIFRSWLMESLRQTDDAFHFPHVTTYDDVSLAESKPMVLVAAPAMFTSGQSLQALRKWAPDKKNLVVMPGYCLPGTPGHEILAGAKTIHVASEPIHVRCQVEYMLHSDHTDVRGVQHLIAQLAPRHVILVHGEAPRMRVFRHIVEKRMRLPCSLPAVGQSVELGRVERLPVLVSPSLLKEAKDVAPPPPLRPSPAAGTRKGAEEDDAGNDSTPFSAVPCAVPGVRNFSGILRKRKAEDDIDAWELFPRSAAGLRAAGLQAHALRFRHQESSVPLPHLRAAWAALQRAGAELSWEPCVPPPSGQLPAGSAFTLCVCSPAVATCRVAPGAKPGATAAVTIEWAMGAEEARPELTELLKAARAT